MKANSFFYIWIGICLLLIIACYPQRLDRGRSKKSLSKSVQEDTARASYVINCKNEWKYEELNKQMINVEVLLFNAKEFYHTFSYPSLLIGKTIGNDTIAILDKEFGGILEIGNKVNIDTSNWTQNEKDILKPMTTVFKDNEKNKLYCSVKTLYWGKIIKQNRAMLTSALHIPLAF